MVIFWCFFGSHHGTHVIEVSSLSVIKLFLSINIIIMCHRRHWSRKKVEKWRFLDVFWTLKKGLKIDVFGCFWALFDVIENTRKNTFFLIIDVITTSSTSSKLLSTHVFYKIDRFLNFGKNWKKIFENWQEITGNYCIIIWGGCKIPDPVPKTKGFWSSPYGLSKECPQITLYLVRAPKN